MWNMQTLRPVSFEIIRPLFIKNLNIYSLDELYSADGQPVTCDPATYYVRPEAHNQ